jgi:hypothetical protein
MRLIDTSTLQLIEVSDPTPRYAILSHRWDRLENEVSFKEFSKGLKTDTSGHQKITNFCNLARERGFGWAWIDTCCIDKRSSAELSEALNSMYSWYQRAEVCYAFLADVALCDWRVSDWWNRGWTLQELIAPSKVVFFDRDWKEISNKKSMAAGIEIITGIPAAVLKGEEPLRDWTVAQKMSWAAHRKTARVEDRAYSLLGLFQINMPMLYGEGNKAFRRLQVEILQKYPDESIFAWQHTNSSLGSVLAESPDDFKDCRSMTPSRELSTDRHVNLRQENPPRVTSWGIELRANARKLTPRETVFIDGKRQQFLWAITLTAASRDGILELPCTIVLARSGLAPYSYLRYECHRARSVEAFWELARRYDIDRVEEGILLYLWFDKDIMF